MFSARPSRLESVSLIQVSCGWPSLDSNITRSGNTALLRGGRCRERTKGCVLRLQPRHGGWSDVATRSRQGKSRHLVARSNGAKGSIRFVPNRIRFPASEADFEWPTPLKIAYPVPLSPCHPGTHGTRVAVVVPLSGTTVSFVVQTFPHRLLVDSERTHPLTLHVDALLLVVITSSLRPLDSESTTAGINRHESPLRVRLSGIQEAETQSCMRPVR
jgi:hypothetical protein